MSRTRQPCQQPPGPAQRPACHPLTATAALVWNGDLPRPLQQILFDTADGVTPPPASSPPAAAWPGAANPLPNWWAKGLPVSRTPGT